MQLFLVDLIQTETTAFKLIDPLSADCFVVQLLVADTPCFLSSLISNIILSRLIWLSVAFFQTLWTKLTQVCVTDNQQISLSPALTWSSWTLRTRFFCNNYCFCAFTTKRKKSWTHLILLLNACGSSTCVQSRPVNTTVRERDLESFIWNQSSEYLDAKINLYSSVWIGTCLACIVK